MSQFAFVINKNIDNNISRKETGLLTALTYYHN